MRASSDIRAALAIFGSLVVVALLVGVLAEPGRARSSFVGAAAPELVGITTAGQPVALAELRGRPVWLTFFSSWCVRCRAENPDIQAVYLEQEPTGGDLALIAVGSGESAGSVAEYARNAGLTFPIVPDPDRVLTRRFAVLALPTHVFIDRAGIVREIRVGVLQPAVMRELVGSISGAGR